MEKFDLAIIGAGPAGYEAADFAARHGLKTVLIEKNSLGGTCLNSGCIPTKTLLHTAEMYHEVTTQAEKIGLSYSDFSVDMMKMQQRKDEVLCTLRDGIGKLMKMRKVTVLKGTGAIIGQNRISVADETQKQVIEADKILIATGSVPAVPPIQGAQYAVTSDELLNSAKAYESLVIIGGGVIGIEFASLYTALGKKVIIIEALDKIFLRQKEEEYELPITEENKQDINYKSLSLVPVPVNFNLEFIVVGGTLEFLFANRQNFGIQFNAELRNGVYNIDFDGEKLNVNGVAYNYKGVQPELNVGNNIFYLESNQTCVKASISYKRGILI